LRGGVVTIEQKNLRVEKDTQVPGFVFHIEKLPPGERHLRKGPLVAGKGKPGSESETTD